MDGWHLCEVTECCRPDHVVLESSSDNKLRQKCHAGIRACRCLPRCLTNPNHIFVPDIPGREFGDPSATGTWVPQYTATYGEQFDDICRLMDGKDIGEESEVPDLLKAGYLQFPVTLVQSPNVPIPHGIAEWSAETIPTLAAAIVGYFTSNYNYIMLTNSLAVQKSCDEEWKHLSV